jgi:hypothetical protein
MRKGNERAFWRDALVPWPGDVVDKMGIPAEDAAYLREVGLPVGVDWSLVVNPPAPGARPSVCNDNPILALDGPVPICVEHNGRVIANEALAAIEGPGKRLVNSNVRTFGQFLMLYEEYRVRVRNLDEEQAYRLIDEIELGMRDSDPAAMGQPNAYWPAIVEQMRAGLL